ncbi:hypothetical protein GCM10009665_10150 [Kitasatospora nipponensis]|uniref:Alkylmercury lyase n=1 Tax=Kitasatospora nipponensis TaxID=258049 RepID=A0ABN1VUQ2_9ACTN
MRVEMLTVPDCPNGPLLEARLAVVLAGCSGVELLRHVVEDQEDAERRRMHGSPTLLIDGRDPFAAPGTAASVSCRLYRTPEGRIDGAPSIEELRRAVDAPAATAGPNGWTGPAGRDGLAVLAPAGGPRAPQGCCPPRHAEPRGQDS